MPDMDDGWEILGSKRCWWCNSLIEAHFYVFYAVCTNYPEAWFSGPV